MKVQLDEPPRGHRTPRVLHHCVFRNHGTNPYPSPNPNPNPYEMPVEVSSNRRGSDVTGVRWL